MNKVLFTILLLCFTFFFNSSTAQQDSIKSIFYSNEHDTVKLNAYYSLVSNYKYNIDSSLNISFEALEIAKRTNSYKHIIKVHKFFASIYYYSGQYKKALISMKSASELERTHAPEKSYTGTLNNMAILYKRIGDNDKAFKIYQQLLQEFSDNHDVLESTYHNLSVLYSDIEDYEKALKYQYLNINTIKKNETSPKLASSFSNLGILHYKMNDYDSALFYLKKSYTLRYQVASPNFYGNVCNSLGLTYKNLNQLDSAIWYLKKSEKVRDSLKLYDVSAQVKNNLSIVYYELNEFPKALSYARNAFNLAYKLNNTAEQKAAHYNLSVAYNKLNQDKKAFYHLHQYKLYNDSLDKNQNLKKFLKSEMEFKLSKEKFSDSIKHSKKLEINDLKHNEESKRKNIILITIIFIGIVILLFAIVIYRSYKNKSKANELISLKNEEINIQKDHLEEKNNEILDSIKYAKGIQDTLLPEQSKIKNAFSESFILYRPKDIVSGDFYWFEEIQNKSYLAVADCTGHGVPGAIVSFVCSNALSKSLLEEKKHTPAEILKNVHQIVTKQFTQNNKDVKDGMDISLISVQEIENDFKITFCGANNGLWIVTKNLKPIEQQLEKDNVNFKVYNHSTSNQNLIEIKPNKVAIGQREIYNDFIENEIILQKNDALYLFTDGFADQFGGKIEDLIKNKSGKKFKSSNFKKLILDIQEEPFSTHENLLLDHFNNWKQTLEQVDDVCVLGVKF